ncbi:hypothetical protein J7302_22455 [Pseudomonas sp. DB1]|uniref:HTH luxR-type domain-containing protein n=1 Tax=Metapseudomonas boanensis TaxID=2822138 RepID=A0ABS5XMD3_9GAMM|nr:helix-turn-helix transcriptional regulator [Pseudomonas boanensis]MBT8768871.1 hypothetical protein [Pseudomonas boanensis]
MAESIDELYGEVNKRRRRPVDPPTQVGFRPKLSVPPPFDMLSQRQLEVARRISKGMTNFQTACELGLTENTVKLYVSQILRLTLTNSRMQLALAMAPVDWNEIEQ